jgi:hypothetical protein
LLNLQNTIREEPDPTSRSLHEFTLIDAVLSIGQLPFWHKAVWASRSRQVMPQHTIPQYSENSVV